MYRLGWILTILTMGLVAIGTFTTVFAQEDTYLLTNETVFSKLRRSAVFFPHTDHMEALGDDQCGSCHHGPDENTGRLVYEEGEESLCNECHGTKKAEGVPALREAYHQNCTGCHRRTIKQSQPSGPTTCGECHLNTPTDTDSNQS